MSKNHQSPSPSSRRFLPWLLIGLVVAVAGVVTIALSGGDDGDAAPPDAATAVVEIADVDISGDSIAAFAEIETETGSQVPNASGVSFDGRPVELLADGQPTVIAFFAHWCPHCQDEVDSLSDYLADSPVGDDVRLVAVSTGVRPDQANYPPSSWFQREGWPTDVLVDDERGSIAAAYGLSAYPFWAVVDADGNLVGRLSGKVGSEQFEALVAAAVSGA